MTEHARYSQLSIDWTRHASVAPLRRQQRQRRLLLWQLSEGLEAGLGGHQAADGLEVALQLGVESGQLGVLRQEGQDGVVDELLFVLGEQTLEKTKKKTVSYLHPCGRRQAN